MGNMLFAANLHIGPSRLGLLTSTYFIAFASAQLPLGIFLDRFGPRIVESFLLLFAAPGAFIFSSSQTLTGVVIGRAFIGFGVSACLMAAFKSYVLFFPEKKAAPSKESFSLQIGGIKKTFKNSYFLRIAPLATVSQAGFASLQGLWSGPWLRDMAGMSRPEIADVLFWSAFAMMCGYVLLGLVAEKLAQKGVTILSTAVIGMALFLGVQALIVFNPGLPVLVLWVLSGFFGTSGILTYSALSSNFPRALSGRISRGFMPSSRRVDLVPVLQKKTSRLKNLLFKLTTR